VHVGALRVHFAFGAIALPFERTLPVTATRPSHGGSGRGQAAAARPTGTRTAHATTARSSTNCCCDRARSRIAWLACNVVAQLVGAGTQERKLLIFEYMAAILLGVMPISGGGAHM
jgi:hypothetical protein